MTPRDEVLRTGEVTLKQGGKLYSATYEVLKGGIVRLRGKTGHLGGSRKISWRVSCFAR